MVPLLSPRFSLVLALLVFLFVPFTAAQSSAPINLTILSASGDGSCVNVGGVALNCTFPFTLNLTVVSLPIPVPAYSLDLVVTNYTSAYYLSVSYLTDAFTPTLVSVRLSAPAFRLPALTLFEASFTWTTPVGTSRTVEQWNPSPAFSAQPWSYPTVSAISGCQVSDSPVLTTNCVPEQDSLTFTGSGFTKVSPISLRISGVNVTSITRTVYLGLTAGAKVVNDSTLTLTLLDGFGFLFLAEHYSSALLTVILSDSEMVPLWQASPVFITMAFLPLPAVTRYLVYGGTATTTGNITTYSGCIPGQSLLNIQGRYLFDVRVTVGGYECSTDRAVNPANYALPTQLVCTLDDQDALTPGLAYDIVISTDEGNVVVPQAIAYTSQPTLARILPCWDDGGFYPNFGFPVARCMSGDTLTIVGRRLVRSGLQLTGVSFQTFYAPPTSLNCSNPQIIDDETMTCVTLPNTEKDYIMTTSKVVAAWGAYGSNMLATYPYDFLNSPRILSIQGCGMTTTNSRALFLVGCQPGDPLTLTGYNLNVTGGTAVRSIRRESTNFAVFSCANVLVVNDSLVTCTLPTASEFPALLNSSQYNVTLYRAVGGPQEFTSNYFAVTFGDVPAPAPVPDPVPSSTESSGSGGISDAVAVVVALVVVLGVVGVGLVGWWMWRRKARGRSDEPGRENSARAFSQQLWVEMSP